MWCVPCIIIPHPLHLFDQPSVSLHRLKISFRGSPLFEESSCWSQPIVSCANIILCFIQVDSIRYLQHSHLVMLWTWWFGVKVSPINSFCSSLALCLLLINMILIRVLLFSICLWFVHRLWGLLWNGFAHLPFYRRFLLCSLFGDWSFALWDFGVMIFAYPDSLFSVFSLEIWGYLMCPRGIWDISFVFFLGILCMVWLYLVPGFFPMYCTFYGIGGHHLRVDVYTF